MKITAVTQKQHSTKCDSDDDCNGNGINNNDEDKSSDDNNVDDDGDGDSGDDNEYHDDSNVNDDNDDDGDDDDGGGGGSGGQWAMSVADGVVWGRRQAAEAVEMGINRKWEQCGYNSHKEVKAIIVSVATRPT